MSCDKEGCKCFPEAPDDDPGPWRTVPNRAAIRVHYRGGQGKYPYYRMGTPDSAGRKQRG